MYLVSLQKVDLYRKVPMYLTILLDVGFCSKQFVSKAFFVIEQGPKMQENNEIPRRSVFCKQLVFTKCLVNTWTKKVLNTNAVGGKKNKVIIIWDHFVLQPFDNNEKCLIGQKIAQVSKVRQLRKCKLWRFEWSKEECEFSRKNWYKLHHLHFI